MDNRDFIIMEIFKWLYNPKIISKTPEIYKRRFEMQTQTGAWLTGQSTALHVEQRWLSQWGIIFFVCIILDLRSFEILNSYFLK